MLPSPGEPLLPGWVPICPLCWRADHDRCEGGTGCCECLCPCFWNPPRPEEDP